MNKFLKKRRGQAFPMSHHIQRDLLLIETPPDLQTWTYRLWILCHGSYISALVGQILLAGSYACTLTGTPSEYEFFYSSAVYGMLSIAGIYQIFWLRFRRSTAVLFERLLVLCHKLETHFDEEELEISKSSRRTMMVVVRALQLTFVFEVVSVCGQPILDARLPPFMRGMKAFSPEMLATQALHLTVMGPIALSSAEYLTTQTKLVFFLTVGYRLIGRRLRQFAMTNRKEVRDAVRLHSEWTSLSAESEKIFSAWNTVFVMHMLLIALLGTVGVISGILAFEITILAPSVGSYIFVMCRLGELLRQQSIEVAGDIYQGKWLDGDCRLRKLLLLPILRAQRPAIMRATLIGPLTLETFLQLLKNWYRFLQFMLSMK